MIITLQSFSKKIVRLTGKLTNDKQTLIKCQVILHFTYLLTGFAASSLPSLTTAKSSLIGLLRGMQVVIRYHNLS